MVHEEHQQQALAEEPVAAEPSKVQEEPAALHDLHDVAAAANRHLQDLQDTFQDLQDATDEDLQDALHDLHDAHDVHLAMHVLEVLEQAAQDEDLHCAAGSDDQPNYPKDLDHHQVAAQEQYEQEEALQEDLEAAAGLPKEH